MDYERIHKVQHHSWKILVEVFLNTCQHVILSVKCMLLAGPLEQTFLCYWQDMGRKVPTQELMTRDMHGVEWPIFFGFPTATGYAIVVPSIRNSSTTHGACIQMLRTMKEIWTCS
ncbi:hypothetical protein KSP39_PZI001772 [Platanthera zijinensis]|uniref:Uncharacterized protein n=1 Tax=Platanthera zijinensis TaxID=2320716 RepID=A0AAP0BXF8_9ASPA